MDEPTTRSTPPQRPEKPDQTPWRVEGAKRAPDGPGAKGDGQGGQRWRFPRWLIYVSLGLLLLNFIVAQQVPDDGGREPVPYSQFFTEVERGNVTEVSSQGDVIQGRFERLLG